MSEHSLPESNSLRNDSSKPEGNGSSGLIQLEGLKGKDFASDQDIRWCPGCGDYGILSAFQSVLAKLGVRKEKTVIVSGIGCASRFPYYIDSYGFHTIHGRAPTIATGLKLSDPELSVWVISGDGDALSIGGNHFIHALRRNIGIKILLFNNQIYGLTKGQYSPTSEQGKRTKSSPYGSLDYPFNPISLALAAEASFVARTIDVYQPHINNILERAAAHNGSAFVEIYQNCNIFNNGAFDSVRQKDRRPANHVELEHGKPLVFGAEREKGLRMNGWNLEVVQIADVETSELLVHDAHADDPSLAFALSRLKEPEFPTPLGVFRDVERTAFHDAVHQQMHDVTQEKGEGTLESLLYTSDSWTI